MHLLHSLYMLSHYSLLSVHYYLYLHSLVLCSSMSLYSLHYMFHFTDYHLPLHILCMFLVHFSYTYMCCSSHYLSHSLLYNSPLYTTGNSTLLMYQLHSLYTLSHYLLPLVHYYLCLHLLVLHSSTSLSHLHNLTMFILHLLLYNNMLHLSVHSALVHYMSHSLHSKFVYYKNYHYTTGIMCSLFSLDL